MWGILFQKTKVRKAVIVRFKNIHLAITTLRNMVRKSWHHDACYTTHSESTAQEEVINNLIRSLSLYFRAIIVEEFSARVNATFHFVGYGE